MKTGVQREWENSGVDIVQIQKNFLGRGGCPRDGIRILNRNYQGG